MNNYANSRWKERGSFSKDILHSYQDIVDAIRTAPYGIDTREAMAQMLIFLYSATQSVGDNLDLDMSPTDSFGTLQELKQKYPNGQKGVYVIQENGKWYFWSELDEVWKEGGVYQASAPIDDIRKVDAKATQNSIKLKTLLDNFTQEVDERKKIDADLIDKAASYLTALELKEVRLKDNDNNLLWDGNNYATGSVYLPKTDKTGIEEGVPVDSSIIGYTFLGHLEEYGLPVLKIKHEKIPYLVNKQSGKLTDVVYSYNSSKNSIGISSVDEDGELSEIKVQGSSSVLYPKKNYTIKFKNNKCLKPEWGYHKKYVLKADWIDPSHLRNEFGAYMWYLLRKRKFTSDYELQNDNGETLIDNSGNNLSGETRVNFLGPRCGAIDSFPILVVINGVYHGLYSLTIPKDDWMAGMGSGKKEAIVSAGKPSKATRFESLATLDSKGNLSGDDFEVEYVSDEDNQSWVAKSLNNMIQEIIDADSKDDITLLDIDSAIDYLIFCLYAENTDGFSKNFLLDTWDGNKWFVTAYDMDGTFGMMFDGKVMLSPWDYGINQIRTTNKLFDKLIKLFNQEIKDEWNKLHNSYLNESIIYYLISNKAKDIPQAAIDADRTRWPGLPGTTMNNLNQILQWISIRTQFLQNEFNTI
ncbi:CotH kinase family protein [Ligilactobacillus sp. MP3]|uniref:CotH kinase family protein n=1 Tax=Ligilactobacillus sp. MP3 TaxID=2965103 RepID=UPI00210E85BB|nr:CotH kinase family protein [Ligilactobacillus sp. MP3]MCQ4117093.1 CotH kinase family protein [Ligilactobacillus sp. MP3]